MLFQISIISHFCLCFINGDVTLFGSSFSSVDMRFKQRFRPFASCARIFSCSISASVAEPFKVVLILKKSTEDEPGSMKSRSGVEKQHPNQSRIFF